MSGWTVTKNSYGVLYAIHADGTEAWINRQGELEIDSAHAGARIPIPVVRQLLAEPEGVETGVSNWEKGLPP